MESKNREKRGMTRKSRGAPDKIRTCGLSLRRRTLYPLSYWGPPDTVPVRLALHGCGVLWLRSITSSYDVL